MAQHSYTLRSSKLAVPMADDAKVTALSAPASRAQLRSLELAHPNIHTEEQSEAPRSSTRDIQSFLEKLLPKPILLPHEDEDTILDPSIPGTIAWVLFLLLVAALFVYLDVAYYSPTDKGDTYWLHCSLEGLCPEPAPDSMRKTVAVYKACNYLMAGVFAISCGFGSVLTRLAEHKLSMGRIPFVLAVILFVLGYWRVNASYIDGNPVLSFILASMGLIIGCCSNGFDFIVHFFVELKYLEANQTIREEQRIRRSDRIKTQRTQALAKKTQ